MQVSPPIIEQVKSYADLQISSYRRPFILLYLAISCINITTKSKMKIALHLNKKNNFYKENNPKLSITKSGPNWQLMVDPL